MCVRAVTVVDQDLNWMLHVIVAVVDTLDAFLGIIGGFWGKIEDTLGTRWEHSGGNLVGIWGTNHQYRPVNWVVLVSLHIHHTVHVLIITPQLQINQPTIF